ncbi:MAG: hypothetical protein DMD86_07840 [Candidatus Rokuibacteriota bacterium]|nr:MAG: hypothetical protein DMD86_07840 [Candidatus Rokubacteria bacterium]
MLVPCAAGPGDSGLERGRDRARLGRRSTGRRDVRGAGRARGVRRTGGRGPGPRGGRGTARRGPGLSRAGGRARRRRGAPDLPLGCVVVSF